MKQISSNFKHSLALSFNGSVYSFGEGTSGQLGQNNLLTLLYPQLIPGLYNISMISTGLGFSVVLRNDNILFSFGQNTYGQLGIGSLVPKKTPTQVSFFPYQNISQITTGESFSLLLLQNNSAYSWGLNDVFLYFFKTRMVNFVLEIQQIKIYQLSFH